MKLTFHLRFCKEARAGNGSRPPTSPPQPARTAEGEQSAPAAPAPAESTGRVWQAMALAVPSRLWLGSVISAHRDKQLIRTLAMQIRACAATTTVLVCVDGLSSYIGAIKRAFSERVPTGKRGRPPQVCPPGLLRSAGREERRPAPCRGCRPPRRPGQHGGRDAGVDHGQWRRASDQHGVHRAVERHLPRLSGPAHAAHPRAGPWAGAAECWHVSGRHGLQLRVTP